MSTHTHTSKTPTYHHVDTPSEASEASRVRHYECHSDTPAGLTHTSTRTHTHTNTHTSTLTHASVISRPQVPTLSRAHPAFSLTDALPVPTLKLVLQKQRFRLRGLHFLAKPKGP